MSRCMPSLLAICLFAPMAQAADAGERDGLLGRRLLGRGVVRAKGIRAGYAVATEAATMISHAIDVAYRVRSMSPNATCRIRGTTMATPAAIAERLTSRSSGSRISGLPADDGRCWPTTSARIGRIGGEGVEPTLGFEPRTCCLRNSCSTAELCRP